MIHVAVAAVRSSMALSLMSSATSWGTRFSWAAASGAVPQYREFLG